MPPRIHVKPQQSTPALRKSLREMVRATCENRPGVYRMLGPTGNVLYVGQSRVVRTRLLSYFRATGRGNKAARILRHAFQIEWEFTATEFGALLRELRLIKQYRPRFNRMMVTDDWPRGYVALTGGAVPGLRVVPRSDHPSAIAMFGPFRKVGELRESVRALADTMQIRDCTLEDASTRTTALWFAHDADHAVTSTTSTRTRVPGCLRHAIWTCPGPCIGEGDSAYYRTQAQTVRAFLEGNTDAPVVALERDMQHASDAMEFERAAVIRDRLARVQWLQQRVLHFHANMDRLTFEYRATSPDGREFVYLIRRGTIRAEVEAPTTDAEHVQLQTLAARIFDGPDPSGADIPLHDLDEFYLVASWFRRRPHERARTKTADTRS